MGNSDEYDDNEVFLAEFARAVAAGGAAFAVAGREGIAGVPSKSRPGIQLDLIWSDRSEAERWADALTETPEIAVLDVAQLLGRYLPGLAASERPVGADWSDGPDEVEIDAGELASAISQVVRDAELSAFDAAIAADRHVWLLRAGDGATGHAVLRGVHERLAVPVFASREAAESAAREIWPDATAVRVSIGEFTQRMLYAGIEHKLVYAPAFVPGRTAQILMPWEIKGRLQALLRREMRAVA